MHSSGDRAVACLVSVGELAWLLMCTLLVTETVACLVSVCELVWCSMCTLLVTETVACLVLGYKLVSKCELPGS